MVNAFGRLTTLTAAIVAGNGIFCSAAYLGPPPIQTAASFRE
jgi:hypothetical protein